MSSLNIVRWFKDIGIADVPSVGGKNASLGELYTALTAEGIRVPNGFALTAEAYRTALNDAGAFEKLHQLLDGHGHANVKLLAKRAHAARAIVYAATGGEDLKRQIGDAYRRLEKEYGKGVAVAVRSSATAEDLPDASFAGQHDSYLHVVGEKDVVEACRRCFASIFTDRAISYRLDKGFDHFKVALSVGVMKMVRSDKAASGVIFTLDTESGFRDVVFITGSYGLGENIVQGKVDTDEFYVYKSGYKAGRRFILRRSLGSKALRLIYAKGHGDASTRQTETKLSEREVFCITDKEALLLAGAAIKIEEHYSMKAGHPMPMDIEWAKDSDDGKLYIVQARPETVASRKDASVFENFELKGIGKSLIAGRAVGERIATGKVRVVKSQKDFAAFKPGEVLVAETTTPDWEPVMKTAAAIVTDHGGRTCHAAIIARELGVPAVVGTGSGTKKLKTGQIVTVCCAEGDVGHAYAGKIPFEVHRVQASTVPNTRTHIMANLGNPELAFSTAMLPNAGVGLARLEFIINEHIGVHPMALLHPEKVKDTKTRAEIKRLTRHYKKPADFFIERLAEGVGTICAAFYPRPVIVRMSDFKTNEYASLKGGAGFEVVESNPMIGFRGASRYDHPAYAEGFALECAAMKRVREVMGLDNLKLMIPFCRRVGEAKKVIDAMARYGLKRGDSVGGKGGLELYVMCEIPNNVIQVDAFAQLFDGFSIGSNDLTQLTLGVDRDSEIVAFDFDERDPGMLEMFRLAITGAHRNGRHIGICGEAPANYPEIAAFLAEQGIDSISVNPSSLMRTMQAVAAAEKKVAKLKAAQ